MIVSFNVAYLIFGSFWSEEVMDFIFPSFLRSSHSSVGGFQNPGADNIEKRCARIARIMKKKEHLFVVFHGQASCRLV